MRCPSGEGRCKLTWAHHFSQWLFFSLFMKWAEDIKKNLICHGTNTPLKYPTSWHPESHKQLEGPRYKDYNDMVMTDMGKELGNGKDLICTSLSQMFLCAQLVHMHASRTHDWSKLGISRIFFWSYARVRIKKRTKEHKWVNYKNRVLMSYLNSWGITRAVLCGDSENIQESY